jgi:isopentenyl-diphosphate delta-isomerase
VEEQLILVDAHDRPIGTGAKLEVHRQGLLHRAFSIFVWNGQGELLIQRRAACKYHSPGLWANTCCGHPRPGEETGAAAQRRLGEELGMRAVLEHNGVYTYRATMPNSLIENEFVHLFSGCAMSDPQPDPEEVDSYRWLRPEALVADFTANPKDYAAWFALYLSQIPARILTPPQAA